MRYLLAGFIGALSTGWLAPLYFAVDCYLYLFGDLSDSLLHGMVGANSFPYRSAMMIALGVSFVWLGLVVFAWSAVAVLRLPPAGGSRSDPNRHRSRGAGVEGGRLGAGEGMRGENAPGVAVGEGGGASSASIAARYARSAAAE